MKRPSFQFYPADWKQNANLRRCSEAARGAWMDVLCVLHDNDEYGVARWPLAELARAAGVALKLARELAEKLVLKGADSGTISYVHTPRHGGKDGEPVILVEGEGPVWFSSRMVKDEWRRTVSGGKTRFTSEQQPSPSGTPKAAPSRSPSRRHGNGATTSSSSSVVPLAKANGRGAELPLGDEPKPASPAKPSDPWAEVYRRGREILGNSAGGVITNLKKTFNDKPRKVLAKLEDAAEQREPLPWINAFLWQHGPPGLEGIGPMDSS